MLETTRTREARRQAVQQWPLGDPWHATDEDQHALGYSLNDVCPCGVPGKPAHLKLDHEAVTA